jgi:hypothetical protein
MQTQILAFIDWNRGVWVAQYRDSSGRIVSEPTDFPAATPSLVVCHTLLDRSPGARVLAKLG